MMLFPLAACGVDKEIDFTVGYESIYDSHGQNSEKIVKRLAEWNVIRGGDARFSELDAKYNEHFFIENSLIVVAFTASNGIDSIQIASVWAKNKKLIVTANIVLNVYEMIGRGIVIIEVKKADISGANSVEIIRNN